MTKAIDKFKDIHQGKSYLDHIVDYLHDTHSDVEEIPLSYHEALSQSLRWRPWKEVSSKGKTKTVYSNGSLSLVLLEDSAAKKEEGNCLRHCVGTVSYEKKVIYSIRENGKSLYTVEVDENNNIQQIKGRNNSSVRDRHKDFFLELVDSGNLSFEDISKMERCLSYRGDDNFIEFINRNELSTIIPHREIQGGLFYSTNKKIKKRGDYWMTRELFWEFQENGLFPHAQVSYLKNGDLSRKDSSIAFTCIENIAPLFIIKALIDNGYAFCSDCFIVSAHISPVDSFRELYKAHPELLPRNFSEAVIAGGRAKFFLEALRLGAIEKESLPLSLSEEFKKMVELFDSD